MTGTEENSLARRAAPSQGCLRMMASTYPLTTLMVSASVSPLEMELPSILSTEIEVPPRREIAAAKDILVRVDGSKKSNATILPSRERSILVFCWMIFASSRNVSIVVRSRSLIEMMCCMPGCSPILSPEHLPEHRIRLLKIKWVWVVPRCCCYFRMVPGAS